MKTRFPAPFILLAGLLLASLSAANPSRPNPQALSALKETLATLAKDPTVRTGTVGFYLAPLEQADQPILKRQARRSFITASTLKSITTGTALEILGPEFRYETNLHYHPATGDLVISGSGDPSLGRPDWEELFQEWTTALRDAGIREVMGRVIADESAWEDQEIPGGWTWQDIGNYYAPPLSPLCFRDNTFRLYFDFPGPPGSPARLYDADPWPAGLTIENHVRAGRPGTGDSAYLFGGPGTSHYTVRGTLAADAARNFIKGALPDPALFCAQAFTGWLNAREVPVHGPPTTTRRANAAGAPSPLPAGETIRIATHRSRPLADLLIPINHRSLNLDCECLLRTLGKGRAAAGIRAIRDHLSAKGLPLDGFEQDDGSGLARTNMITPELLSRANAAVLTGPHAAAFLKSLPLIGTPGSTLGPLAASGPATLHAKSGTIERVKGYTGQVSPPTGPRYIFTLLINNYDGSYSKAIAPRLDEIFEALSQL